MRQYLRDYQPFGFQIIEGEIVSPHVHLDDLPLREAESSLALTRSRSYTLQPTACEGWLSGLIGGAPSTSESSEDDGDYTAHSVAETVPIAPGTRPAGARSGASTTTPSKAAKGVAKESKAPGSESTPGEADEDASAGDVGQPPTTPDKRRRSKRIQGEEPSPDASEAHAEGAGENETGDTGTSGGDGTTAGTAAATAAAAAAAADGEAPADPKGDPDPKDPPADGSDGKGAKPAEDRDQLIARLKRRLSHLKMKRKRKKDKDRFAKETKGLKRLVDRAKAIDVITKQTIDPQLWLQLPGHIKIEAYNKANREVWATLSTSLGYRYSHLIGQLREGDGKAAWQRLAHLHAEETHGAQAHYLQKLMSCTYKSATGTEAVGHSRKYAEALQRINKLYKLSAGKFVQPDILMSRLLSLPRGFDHVVETIESINGMRAGSGLSPLDFHEVLGKVVQFENRHKRRSSQVGINRHYPARGSRWGNRRREGRSGRNRDSAHVANSSNNQGSSRGSITCWNCGETGHIARNCPNKSVGGGKAATGDRQVNQRATASRAQQRRGTKRFNRKPKRASVGFLAVEQASQAFRANNGPDDASKMIIDSGASGNFCVKGTKLENARATHRVINSAGDQTLVGKAVGDFGALVDTVEVEGLRTGLASAGMLANHYQAEIVFTPTRVYAYPLREQDEAMRIGTMAQSGLYVGDAHEMKEVLTTANGFTDPRAKAVGALCEESPSYNIEECPSQEAMYAMAAMQRSTKGWRSQNPRGALTLRRHRRGRRRGTCMTRRSPMGTRGVHPSRTKAVGHAPRHSGNHGITSIGSGKPTIRFIDLCCGLGGFTQAGVDAGWTPVASVDFCKSVANWFGWNFSHPFERVDLTSPKARTRLVRKYEDIDVVLFSPPCQPYSVAGAQRPGDRRTRVVRAGIMAILEWMPLLVVIECVANFITCEANPVYREVVVPLLREAGYEIYNARCNAAQCGVPAQRDRVYIVAHRYPRPKKLLEKSVAWTNRSRKMVLSEWFPGLKLVCHTPCHTNPAVFDATAQPHPTMRTMSLYPVNKRTYRARRGDAGSICDAVELTLDQKLSLAGMGEGFHWPRKGYICTGPCCRPYCKYGKRSTDFLSRSFGNIVIPQHAASVLRQCEIEAWLKGRAGGVKATKEARILGRRANMAVKSSPTKAVVGANILEDFMSFIPPDAHSVYAKAATSKERAAVRRTDRGLHMSSEPKTAAKKLMRFHKQMGHISKQNIKRILKAGKTPMLDGVTVEDVDAMADCDVCAQSKLTKQPHNTRGLKERKRAKGINFVVHTDSMTRTVPSLLKKHTMIQVFIDEHTRYGWVEFFKGKSYHEFSDMLARAETRLRAQHRESAEYRMDKHQGRGRPVLKYFSDQASEMVSGQQRARLARLFISLTIVSPSAKLSNGIAERANRTLLDIARSLLVGSELPIVFWAEAFEMATNIYNRMSHSANPGGKSPYEMYYGHPPDDWHRFRVFGCKCFVHEDKNKRKDKSKLNATARPCVYLGLSKDDSRSHYVFNPRTYKFFTSTSVVFREDEPGGELVRDCRAVINRMKSLVWGKRNPRGHEKGDEGAASSPIASDSEEGTDEESASSSDSDTVDTWNQVYHAKNNETLSEIADAFDINLEELQSHNEGIPGCDIATGKLHVDAKLKRGTGIWVPDDAVIDRIAREELSSALGAASNALAAGQGVTTAGKEEGVTGPTRDNRSTEGSVLGASGSSPYVGYSVAAQEGFTAETDALLTCAKKVAEIIVESDDPAILKSKIPPFVTKAEGHFDTAYQVVLRDLSHTLARDVPTPKSYREALQGEFADAWNEAVLKELRNLETHDVWEWCELPEGRTHTIDATWAWRVKPNSLGFVDKLKARLCARGFREIYGMDYVETHAPVTTLTTWRACLAEAARPPWKVHVWDVASAYLLSEIPEETPIYLRPFEGLKVPDIPHKRPLCLKLKRCLYGLRSSGRRWNQTIDKKLKELGFRQSRNDPCLYIKERGKGIIRLNLHVDDCCATFNDEEMYIGFFNELKKDYKLSESFDNNMFLGMLIDRTKDGGIQVHQRHFLDEVLAKYNAEHLKPVINPARKEIKLSKEQCPKTPEEKQDMANVPYRQVVGSLMYLANGTRPDIAHALNSVARFCANPGRMHWNALKWILRYLAGTKDLCIRFGKKVPDMPFSALHGNVDGSYGDDVDDRRSTTGYNFISWGGPVVWRSQKQKSVSLSTCESEYMAASEAGKEAVWIMRVYKEDFGYTDLSVPTYGDLSEKEFEGAQPLTIFEDNQGTIDLSRKPGALHKRSKHINIRYHWIRERIASGELKLSKIDTSLNTADIFTKATSNQTFVFLRDKLVHPREIVGGKASANLAGQHPTMGPIKCLICGEEGHLEPECPIYKRPDELQEEENVDVESKHSESLLVARPDGQHKGSNDQESATPQTGMGTRDMNRASTHENWNVAPEVWAVIHSLAQGVLALEDQVRRATHDLRRLRSSMMQGRWRAGSATNGNR